MINRIFTVVVFLLSSIIYLLTMAPSTSFWDTGEFIGVSNNLGVTHPSGAPLYILIGNFFTTLFFFISDIGARVNLLSVICSSLSVTLLYLIIVNLIKNWFKTKSQIEPLGIYISGLVGSLLFAFTDSQWFNAVESEVYAMSMLSTALVVWLTLKWTENRGQLNNARYIVLIAYVFGMSIGVHPLNLLAIPFVILTIYFNHTKDNFGGFLADNLLTFMLGAISFAGFEILGSNLGVNISATLLVIIISLSIKLQIVRSKNPNYSTKNFILRYFRRISIPIISLSIFGIAYYGVLLGFTTLIQHTYRLITNSGTFLTFWNSQKTFELNGLDYLKEALLSFYIPLFIALSLIIGILLLSKIKRGTIKMLIASVLMFYIGYSTYTSIIIRAQQNPNINIGAPTNPDRFKEYIFREQYGTDLPKMDVWNILKYYLGGDKSTESEKANFISISYPTTNNTYVIESKANNFNNIENGNIKSINKACGTLMQIDVMTDEYDSDFIKLDNIVFINQDSAPLEFKYYKAEGDIEYGNPEIDEGCDLPENHVLLSDQGKILYNSSLEEIAGFSFEVIGPIKKSKISIGSDRINHKHLISSPNKIRWIPALSSSNIPNTALGSVLSNADIMDFIVDYQINEMYFRYFGWQFIGREFDKENFTYSLETKNTAFLDENLIKEANDRLRSDATNKEFNNSIARYKSNVDWTRYGLPFALIFGIIGMIYHFIRDPRNAFSVFTLFIVTGLLILIYINQTDPQPRERDYAYVGSFFAFSIWIGLGCMALFELGFKLIQNINQNSRKNLIVFISIIGSVLIGVMPLNYLINDFKVHNRSGNFAARDFGYNHIISCEPNSVLLTVGDNDTYSLWFNQETNESIADQNIRVINLSLLNAPWYIEQIDSNGMPGNIIFNFNEPLLTTNAKNQHNKDPRVPIEFDEQAQRWYLDINENQKRDKYDSNDFIKSFRNDPFNSSITYTAIKRWAPSTWAAIEEKYFKYEITKSIEGKGELLNFIKPSSENRNKCSQANSKEECYFELYEDSYKVILENFIRAGLGIYQDIEFQDGIKPNHYKNMTPIWGKTLGEKGEDIAYYFPIWDFIDVFNPTIQYKNETINFTINRNQLPLRLQDFAILKILEDLEEDRNFYFTSSVRPNDYIGLGKYIEYQGLVSEVLPPSKITEESKPMLGDDTWFMRTGANYFNEEKFEENVFKKYQFKNLTNSSTYYSSNNMEILQTYWEFLYPYLNESRYTDTSNDCSSDIKEKILKIKDKISHDVIKVGSFYEEPYQPLLLINLYYAAELFEDYQKMLDELINSPKTSMKGLIYILKTLPPDDRLLDYKKNKVKEILGKLDMKSLIIIEGLYESALYKSQIDFESIYDVPMIEEYNLNDFASSFSHYKTIEHVNYYRENEKVQYEYDWMQFISLIKTNLLYDNEENFIDMDLNQTQNFITNRFNPYYGNEELFVDLNSNKEWDKNFLFDKNCDGEANNIDMDISNDIIEGTLIKLTKSTCMTPEKKAVGKEGESGYEPLIESTPIVSWEASGDIKAEINSCIESEGIYSPAIITEETLLEIKEKVKLGVKNKIDMYTAMDYIIEEIMENQKNSDVYNQMNYNRLLRLLIYNYYSISDCAGTPNGDATVDNCGICDSDSSNDCVQDCAGEWGGNAVVDECGVCSGDNSSCKK